MSATVIAMMLLAKHSSVQIKMAPKLCSVLKNQYIMDNCTSLSLTSQQFLEVWPQVMNSNERGVGIYFRSSVDL